MFNPVNYFRQLRYVTNIVYRLEDEINDLYHEVTKLRKDVDKLKK